VTENWMLDDIAKLRDLAQVYRFNEPDRYARLLTGLEQAAARLQTPVIFHMAPGGRWLVGVADEVRTVPGDDRGLLAAWTAMKYGSANLADFVFGDEPAGDDSLRRSIRKQCAAWAESVAQCPELAEAFRQITVDSSYVTYTGPRRIDTGI
jgi:hypothetical protein